MRVDAGGGSVDEVNWLLGNDYQLNNKIKVLKRRCYGITNPISLFRRIWLDLSGYEAFAH
jgi:hypothetical protein